MAQIVVSGRHLCEVWNCSSETISRNVRAGMPRLDRGKFDLDVCWKWYVDRQQEKFDAKLGGLGVQEQDARNKCAQADLREIQLAKIRGEIVNAHDVETEWSRMQAITKTKLLAVPAKIAVRGLACSTPKELQTMIDSEIREALAELSRVGTTSRSGAGKDRTEPSRALDAAAASDGEPMGRPKQVHTRRRKSGRTRKVEHVPG
jgi:phage terminase Nu1 subunit (DNA packaging protein)